MVTELAARWYLRTQIGHVVVVCCVIVTCRRHEAERKTERNVENSILKAYQKRRKESLTSVPTTRPVSK